MLEKIQTTTKKIPDPKKVSLKQTQEVVSITDVPYLQGNLSTATANRENLVALHLE